MWPSSLTNDFPGRSYSELEKIKLSKSFVKSKKKKENYPVCKETSLWGFILCLYEILFDILGILQIG